VGGAAPLHKRDLSNGTHRSSVLYRCPDLHHSFPEKSHCVDAPKGETSKRAFPLTTDVPVLWVDHLPLKGILPGMWKAASSDAVRVNTKPGIRTFDCEQVMTAQVQVGTILIRTDLVALIINFVAVQPVVLQVTREQSAERKWIKATSA